MPKFGAGLGGKNSGIDGFNWRSVGITWYLDWGFTGGGEDYLAMVGAWENGVRQEEKDAVSSAIKSFPQKYPDGCHWVVGNEIFYDDGRNSLDYAEDFTSWYHFLKGLNPTFKVGTGALLSAQVNATTVPYKFSCGNSLPQWKSSMRLIKANDVVPDFVTMHGYTPCSGWFDTVGFYSQLGHYKQAIYDVGLGKLPFWITEWGPLWPKNSSLYAIKNYMRTTVEMLKQSGVSRAAWFALYSDDINNPSNSFPALDLCNHMGQPLPLGTFYSSLIR